VLLLRERGGEREAYSSGKHVLIPIVKVIFHVLEGGKGKLLLYNNCELSLLSLQYHHQQQQQQKRFSNSRKCNGRLLQSLLTLVLFIIQFQSP
jgi:hypothetical protein